MELNLTNSLPLQVKSEKSTSLLLKSNSPEFGGIEPEKTFGLILDEYGEHWGHTCPNCQAEYESTGFFDSSLIHNCNKCKKDYVVCRIYWPDDSYIQ